MRLLAEQGVDQFLDLGCGLPSAGTDDVHQVAQAVDPRARTVYVDSDPIVLTHARALLGGYDGVGHSPAEAEGWVSQFSSWADADPAHIDLQSQLNAERWRQRSTRRSDLWVAEYADLARMWADHRTR